MHTSTSVFVSPLGHISPLLIMKTLGSFPVGKEGPFHKQPPPALRHAVFLVQLAKTPELNVCRSTAWPLIHRQENNFHLKEQLMR